MQPRFPIVILVLQPERLVRIRINPLVPVQTAPGAIFAVPQQIAVHIGHLARNADLVAVEIGEVVAALAHFAVGVVMVAVVAHQLLTIEGDGSEAVRRRRERRFSRGRPYTI